MNPQKAKQRLRTRRAKRVRKNVFGTPQRPRLSVHRSLTNMYSQIIDDTAGRTLVSVSTLNADVKNEAGNQGGNVKAAAVLGEKLAAAAKERGINQVVFDRGPYRYHGRVKALADAARKAGLAF